MINEGIRLQATGAWPLLKTLLPPRTLEDPSRLLQHVEALVSHGERRLGGSIGGADPGGVGDQGVKGRHLIERTLPGLCWLMPG